MKRPPLLRKCLQNSPIVSFADNNGFTGGEDGGFGSRKACSDSGLVGPRKGEDACLLRKSGERSDRESARRSLIKVADSSTIPGSTMKQASIAPAADQRVQNTLLADMPTTSEVEEFFAREEHLWQCLFIKKYNFDVVNDLPLPGRYEWVKKSP